MNYPESANRVATRYLKAAAARLPGGTRGKINEAFRKLGLDGNGRFVKAEHGYAKAVEALAAFGIELDGIVDSFKFNRLEGRVTVDIAFTNPSDLFSPTSISNSVLVITFYKHDDNKFEVLAYMS